MALQSERLVRQHELRGRYLDILRYDRQRQLCEEIITRQPIIEDSKVKLPPDLQEQQTIRPSVIVTPDKLPLSEVYSDPIFRKGVSTSEMSGSETSDQSPPSSAESEQEPLPPLNDQSVDMIMGHSVSRPGIGLRLPPLPPSPPIRLTKTSASSR